MLVRRAGFEPTASELKAPCTAYCAIGAKPMRLLPSLIVVFLLLVAAHGYDPCFPAHRAGALTTRRRGRYW